MLIDWFTVGAQILNFLILVWLLRHFLYQPILDAIDAREKRIASALAEADAKRAQAQTERDDFAGKNKAFDEQRSVRLEKAAQDAASEREHLLAEARNAADSLRAAQAAALQNDRTRLSGEITRLATVEVFAIARKTLADLADVSLEERLGEVFTRRLGAIDRKTKETVGAALKASPEPALVRCSFDLPAEQKAAIQNALNECFSAEIRTRFEIASESVCGIELTANGQKIAWTITDYLASLEHKVGVLLDRQSNPAPQATSKPPANASAAREALAHAETT